MSGSYIFFHSTAGLGGSKYFIVTFKNRDAADLWWREMYEIRMKTSGVYPVRYTPQYYYCYNASTYQWKSLVDKKWDLVLGYREVGFTPEMNTLPPSLRTDYISGKSFCIRSRTRPHLFWSTTSTQGSIRLHLSNCDYPTRFIIERTEAGTEGTVMIPDDTVTLRPITNAGLDSPKVDVSAVRMIPSGNMEVPLSPAVLEFQFGHITTKGGFFVTGEEDNRIMFDIRGKVDGSLRKYGCTFNNQKEDSVFVSMGEDYRIVFDPRRNAGEKWELHN
ncbi:hypothetical protein NP233_g2761 [Leucocoprinus birnbaumii]|uniref:Uncharacterized protein n=1 Tax=Leucocoprinus birnbaumii TaxID=56174 RepID=A0AAD5VXQ5_9AGAR|nr:hypothetical protein NP233_g2761 [Leucocoprinus birnbaumii]